MAIIRLSCSASSCASSIGRSRHTFSTVREPNTRMRHSFAHTVSAVARIARGSMIVKSGMLSSGVAEISAISPASKSGVSDGTNRTSATTNSPLRRVPLVSTMSATRYYFALKGRERRTTMRSGNACTASDKLWLSATARVGKS